MNYREKMKEYQNLIRSILNERDIAESIIKRQNKEIERLVKEIKKLKGE